MRNAGLEEAQAGIKNARRNTNNLRYADDATLMADSEVAQSCLTLCNPMDYGLPGPVSLEFSSQECWSGLSFPTPGDLPNPGVEPGSPALQADSLPSEPPGKPLESRLPGEISITSDMQMTPPLWQKAKKN